jgi:hypothetical protein
LASARRATARRWRSACSGSRGSRRSRPGRAGGDPRSQRPSSPGLTARTPRPGSKSLAACQPSVMITSGSATVSVGKSIGVYLADGTPGGLLTAEIMNWTGHDVAAPRCQLPELLKRPEISRNGIYLLVGDDPESLGGTPAYFGEGQAEQHASRDDVHVRTLMSDRSISALAVGRLRAQDVSLGGRTPAAAERRDDQDTTQPGRDKRLRR